MCRQLLCRHLAQLQGGELELIDHDQRLQFGSRDDQERRETIYVHDPRFYRQVVWGGSLGAAEAYLCGYWDTPDLTATMRLLAKHAETLSRMEQGSARLLRPLRYAAHWMRRNTRLGSQRNIAQHYDLSNDFFALMLDPSMTYSSGYYASPQSTLAEASQEKYDRICRKLRLTPDDHVLEIGTGWGGFALHAATHYGCRVTTTTISQQQFDYAHNQFQQSAVGDRITLLKRDYRDLTGQYDKLVSIEMIEAVGEQYLSSYFAKCAQLLKPNGAMALQAITIPDQRYDRYRKSVDFIQRYIFPGGFLPSHGAMAGHWGRVTDFRLSHFEDFSAHYARTLRDWREQFERNLSGVRQLGFEERFIRMWRYYLCYCEAGFDERQVGVGQYLLAKPDWR